MPVTLYASVINFEGFPDSTILTTQYPGLNFANAIILTAGITLNEFEFPAHSGVNVASDNGGPMTIIFSPPVQSFSGFFTYSEMLTLRAFDTGSNQVATATSHFTNNEALSGVVGSIPNEILQVSAAAISKVTITGDPAGGSFVLDDASLGGPATTTIPVLSPPMLAAFALLLAGLGACAARSKTGNLPRSLAVAVFLFFLSFGALWLSAQPQGHPRTPFPPRINDVVFSRSAIPANQATPVTVTARITHPARIPDSVNVIRLDAAGMPAIIGRLHEDASAGDGIYTLQIVLNEPSPGRIQFQVSAAFHGQVRRVLSEPFNMVVGDSN